MTISNSLRTSILLATALAAFLWGIKIIESVLGTRFYELAIYPRTLDGLYGVVTAPLVHGSWEHLLGNTVPLVFLGSMLIYGYPRSAFRALAGIWLLSGLGVWLFARSSYHLGASGLTHGIFFYLFVAGLLRRDRRSSALLMLAFYLYGGMVMTILPMDPGVSFESHFFGAMAGAICAYAFRNLDPKPPRKRYPWQRPENDEVETEEEDPVIGDQWKGQP